MEVELGAQILLGTDRIVVVAIRGEELASAFCAGRHGRSPVHRPEDDEIGTVRHGFDYRRLQAHSGAPPLHALKYRCGQLDNSGYVALFGFHANSNAARRGERIRDHFKFLAVKAYALTDSVPEALHAGTDFRN